MRRPLFYIGSGMLWTLFLLALTGEVFAAVLGGILLLAAPALWFLLRGHPKRVFYLCVLAVCALACGLYILRVEFWLKPQQEQAGKTAHVEGYVSEVLSDSQSGSHRCVVTASVEGLDVHGTVRVRLSSRSYEPALNDWVSFNGSLYELGEGDPDMQDYYHAHRLVLGAYTYEKISVTELGEAPISRFRYQVRRAAGLVDRAKTYMTDNLYEVLPESTGSILEGMLLGDKSRMDEADQETFRVAGVLHLFAVSGFHVSLWTMLLYRGLLRAGAGKRLAGAGGILFVLFFMALTGFSASAVRAGIMLILLLLGRTFLLHADSLNSLGVAALLLTLPNPFAGGDAGLLLSYFATVGILAVYPPMMRPVLRLVRRVHNQPVRKFLERTTSLLLISASTFVLTLPCVMLLFGTVSLVAPLSNLLVTTVASPAILLSGISVLIAAVPVLGLLSRWGLLIAALIVKYMTWVCGVLAKLPFATIRLDSPGVELAVAACLLLCAAALLLYAHPERHSVAVRGSRNARRPARLTALLCAIILLASGWSEQVLNRKVLSVTATAVGNGMAVIVCYDGSAVVIGCGGDYGAAGAISDVLAEEQATRLAALVVPRAEETESSAFRSLVGTRTPQELVAPSGFDTSAVSAESHVTVSSDAHLDLFPDVELDLHSSGDSPAALLTAGGLKILLLFRPSVDPADLTAAFGGAAETANILICRADLPDGLNYNNFYSIIVSAETADAGRWAGVPNLAVTDPGGVTLRVADGRYQIRRRNA